MHIRKVQETVASLWDWMRVANLKFWSARQRGGGVKHITVVVHRAVFKHLAAALRVYLRVNTKPTGVYRLPQLPLYLIAIEYTTHCIMHSSSWYCCQCGNGPSLISVEPACSTCSHWRCSSCHSNEGIGRCGRRGMDLEPFIILAC